MLSSKTRGNVGGEAGARALAGYGSVGGEQLFSFASLLFLGFYFSVFLFIAIYYHHCYYFHCYFILFQLLTCFLSQPMNFVTFTLPILFPCPTGGK